MKNDPPEQRPLKERMADTGNFLYVVASGHEACISPFLRKDFGTEAPGMSGLYGFIMLFAYGSLTNSSAVLAYLLIWLVLVATHRMKARLLAKSGRRVHSRYTGWPWLAMKIPFVRNQVTAKVIIEPMICFLAGTLLCPLSIPLGAFVLAGFASFRIKAGIDNEVMRVRTQRMRDAYLEQQEMSERFENFQ